MAELPLEPVYSHLILTSLEEKFGCSDSILSTVSILSADNIFYIPKDSKGNLFKVLSKFKCPNSDHLTKLNIFNKYLLSQNKKSFCKENLLNKKSIKRALLIRHQLSGYLQNIINRRKKNGQEPSKKMKKDDNIYSYVPKMDFDEDKILMCLAEGFQSKSAKLNANGIYVLVIYKNNKKVVN